MQLKELASSCSFLSDSSLEIIGAASLQKAGPHEITCFNNAKYLEALRETKAGACFVKAEYAQNVPLHTIPLVVAFPYAAFGKVLQCLFPHALRPIRQDQRQSAFIHPSARIGEGCVIGAFCVLEEGVILGEHVTLGASCVVNSHVHIGDYSYLEDHVTLTHADIGERVFIKTGARIGQPGFGFDMVPQGAVDIPQLGKVIIHDDVQIGANACIDRGSLENTIIHKGVRIDNLVQIAHNVEIGSHSVIVAQVGIAGSTHIGSFVAMGGQVGIAGHLSIGNQVQVAAQSGVMRDLQDKEIVGGSPAVPIRQWHRQTLYLREIVQKK